MSSLLNVGSRALTANQAVLQTVGNNIANVNTPGYSRQTVTLENVPGQFSGSGYVGKGVEVASIQRAYDQFLTRQSAVAGAISASDTARADKLHQLETLFQGGATGLGAAVSDMLNAFSDVASAPTDLTARTVALTKVNETALRMRATAGYMDDMQLGLTQEIGNKVTSINNLASGIASVNEKISRAQGNGQTPNDLLDQRDQLVRELNQYIQTTSIPATDGTTGIFIGSQALVLGVSAATLSLTTDDFGDPLASQLALTNNGKRVLLNENTLGGGEVPGLIRFQNTDMLEARNLLGRYTLAVSTSVNDQHKLGLDLDGFAGGNLFTPINLNTNNNVLAPKPPAAPNSAASGNLTLAVRDASKLVASDYDVSFTSGAAGNVIRRTDGVSTAFTFTPGTLIPPVDGSFMFFNPTTGLNDLPTLDGLALGGLADSAPAAGDRFLLKPFSTSANSISTEFSSPRALAVASPVAGKMGATNTGSLQLASLVARSNPPANVPVLITFTSANSYSRSDDLLGMFTYTSGQAIEGSVPATTPLSEWSLTLQGVPKIGDTFTIGAQPAAMRNLNSGNANALMKLRDVAMFDGATLTDGYAGLISQIGIRAQSANYAAEVSGAIAASLETDRTAVSGVNLDEEAAKLLQFQQAYQASAKVIQIAQGIFDTLIQSLGR